MKKDWPRELSQLLTDCWKPVHTTRPDLSEVLPVLRKLHSEVVAAEPASVRTEASRPSTAP